MKCDDCGAPMTTERCAVRRYDIGGLPHVVLQGIEVSHCPKCGKEEIAIPRMAQLHRVLAAQFVKQQRMIAPVEIRFLRKHMGLSTEDFGHMMGVARETVTRWETGAQTMGSQAERLLRALVMGHEKPESYVVEDLLRSLKDSPVPEPLPAFSVCNSPKDGWTPTIGRALAMA